MDDARIVRRGQGQRDLSGDGEHFGQLEWAGGDAVGKRRSFDQLEDERVSASRVFRARRCLEAIDMRHVRMVE
jgi:hypothetical protein